MQAPSLSFGVCDRVGGEDTGLIVRDMATFFLPRRKPKHIGNGFDQTRNHGEVLWP